jgi:hypothetical protein
VHDAFAPGKPPIRIGPSGRAALRLLACCPRLPTDVAAVLLGIQHTRSAAQLLLRLRTAGLADYLTVRPGPLVGSKVVRLWILTPAGQTIVCPRRLALPLETSSCLPCGQPARRRDITRQRDVPLLVVAYRLLACFVHELGRPVHVAAWEHPWIRTFSQPGTGRARHVRLPADKERDEEYVVNPFAFLWRHYLELRLKALMPDLRDFSDWTGGTATIPHDLVHLWSTAEHALRQLGSPRSADLRAVRDL